MKALKLLLTIFLATILAGVSCEPNFPDRPLIKLDRDFLTYFAFPEGSYWIYEEEGTGKLDSAYILTYDLQEEINSTARPSYDYEILYLKEVIRGNTFSGIASPSRLGDERMRYDYTQYDEGLVFVQFSDISFDSSSHFLENPSVAVIDGVEISGIVYPEVVKFYHSDSLASRRYESIWYVKDIGVIRRVYWDGTIWNLVRYHHAE